MRDLTAPMQAALAAVSLIPVYIAEIELAPSSPPQYARAWTGLGTLTWNGATWDGVGNFGAIGQVEENDDVAAAGLVFTLSGIPSDMLALALNSIQQGQSAKLWIGALDTSGNLIADPYNCFVGRVDSLELDEGGDTSTIKLTAENRLIDLQRTRESRFTHEDQQVRSPGDLGFEYVPEIQEMNLVWGKGSPIPRISTGGGGAQPDDPNNFRTASE